MTRNISTIDIHRTTRGGIDFDFYRTRATALRGAAHHDATALKFLSVGVLMSAAMLVVFLVLALARPATVVDHVPAPVRVSAIR